MNDVAPHLSMMSAGIQACQLTDTEHPPCDWSSKCYSPSQSQPWFWQRQSPWLAFGLGRGEIDRIKIRYLVGRHRVANEENERAAATPA
jgi:hypothetical protein